MNIGVIALARSTFDIDFAKEKLSQCVDFLHSTEHKIFGNWELLLDESNLMREIENLKETPLEFILILQATFTDAQITSKISTSFNLPLGIWAFPEPRLGGRLRLNAFCGLNLASHCLAQKNQKFSWIYADPKSINNDKFCKLFEKKDNKVCLVKKEQSGTTSERANLLKYKISNFKIARIGNSPEGFDTCHYSQEKLDKLCGIKVDEIELDKFLAISKKIGENRIKETYNRLEGQIAELKSVNRLELERSLKLNESLKEFQKKGEYNAFAIRCWPEMFTKYGGAVCGPVSIMTERKVPCACEADVYGAVSQLILQEVSKQAVFLTDIVDIDYEDNSGVFWHCGQAPISMCDPDFTPRATIHTNRKMPLLFEFPLKAGQVTIMRVSQSFGEQKMMISRGNILKRELPFTGTSGVIRFDRHSKDVLEDIISSGLEHHVAIAYGDHVELLSELAMELSLPVLYF